MCALFLVSQIKHDIAEMIELKKKRNKKQQTHGRTLKKQPQLSKLKKSLYMQRT